MRKWTETSALEFIKKSCKIDGKVIHPLEDEFRGLTSCSAISYLCNYCGYKLT